MPRQYKMYLTDILKCINNIEVYTRGISYEDYLNNQMLQDAVIRNLEIIGEAVKNLPEYVVNTKDYQWARFARMRDLLTHFYFGINHKMVWGLVKKSLPELKGSVDQLLSGE